MELFRWLVLCCVALFLSCSSAAAVGPTANNLQSAIVTLLKNSIEERQAYLSSYEPRQLSPASNYALREFPPKAKADWVERWNSKSLINWALSPEEQQELREAGTTRQVIAAELDQLVHVDVGSRRTTAGRNNVVTPGRRAKLIYLLRLKESGDLEQARWLADRYLDRVQSLSFSSNTKKDYLMALALAWAAYRDRSNRYEEVPALNLIQEAAHTAIERQSKSHGYSDVNVQTILATGKNNPTDQDYVSLVGHFRNALHQLERAEPFSAARKPDANGAVSTARRMLGQREWAALLQSADEKYATTDSTSLTIANFAHMVVHSEGIAGPADPTDPRFEATRTRASAGTARSRANDAGPSGYYQNERDGIAARRSASSFFQRQGQQDGAVPRGSDGPIRAMDGRYLPDLNYPPDHQP